MWKLQCIGFQIRQIEFKFLNIITGIIRMNSGTWWIARSKNHGYCVASHWHRKAVNQGHWQAFCKWGSSAALGGNPPGSVQTSVAVIFDWPVDLKSTRACHRLLIHLPPQMCWCHRARSAHVQPHQHLTTPAETIVVPGAVPVSFVVWMANAFNVDARNV